MLLKCMKFKKIVKFLSITLDKKWCKHYYYP